MPSRGGESKRLPGLRLGGEFPYMRTMGQKIMRDGQDIDIRAAAFNLAIFPNFITMLHLVQCPAPIAQVRAR
jgi:hypothetical protein